MTENRPASSNRAVVVVAAVIGVLVVVLGLVLAQTLTFDDDPVAPGGRRVRVELSALSHHRAG